MKKGLLKEILILTAFIVAPAGIIAGTYYYGPKVKKWYTDKKEKKEDGKI